MASGPKFGNKPSTDKTAEKPRTEADVLARSAEVVSRGSKYKKTGRPVGPEPIKNVGVTLPIRLIEALDELAARTCGRNRSLALVEILDGRLKIDTKNKIS